MLYVCCMYVVCTLYVRCMYVVCGELCVFTYLALLEVCFLQTWRLTRPVWSDTAATVNALYKSREPPLAIEWSLSGIIQVHRNNIGTAPIITTVSARSCYIASKWTFLTAPKQSHFRSGWGRGSPAARFAPRGACPVRVKYCLVDKRSQPRTETIAIMALMEARLFLYFGKQTHARSYELSVYESIKSPWTTPGTLVYHGASHIPSASASCTFELFLVDLTMAMDICSPASPSKFLDQLENHGVCLEILSFGKSVHRIFCCWKKQPGDA